MILTCLWFDVDHDVYAWGVNTFGQLGIPEAKKDVFYPTLVESLRGIPIIGASTGRAHSLFLSGEIGIFIRLRGSEL